MTAESAKAELDNQLKTNLKRKKEELERALETVHLEDEEVGALLAAGSR